MMFSHTGVTSSAMSEKCDLDFFLNNAKAVTKSIHPLYSDIGDVTYQKYQKCYRHDAKWLGKIAVSIPLLSWVWWIENEKYRNRHILMSLIFGRQIIKWPVVTENVNTIYSNRYWPSSTHIKITFKLTDSLIHSHIHRYSWLMWCNTNPTGSSP